MGYKMPNVVKEIYLPINVGDDLSVEDYREKYGINLKDFIALEGGYINIKFGISKVFLVDLYIKEVYPYIVLSQDGYESGSAEGASLLYGNPEGQASFCIKFYIDKDDDFSIENVKIKYIEI